MARLLVPLLTSEPRGPVEDRRAPLRLTLPAGPTPRTRRAVRLEPRPPRPGPGSSRARPRPSLRQGTASGRARACPARPAPVPRSSPRPRLSRPPSRYPPPPPPGDRHTQPVPAPCEQPMNTCMPLWRLRVWKQALLQPQRSRWLPTSDGRSLPGVPEQRHATVVQRHDPLRGSRPCLHPSGPPLGAHASAGSDARGVSSEHRCAWGAVRLPPRMHGQDAQGSVRSRCRHCSWAQRHESPDPRPGGLGSTAKEAWPGPVASCLPLDAVHAPRLRAGNDAPVHQGTRCRNSPHAPQRRQGARGTPLATFTQGTEQQAGPHAAQQQPRAARRGGPTRLEPQESGRLGPWLRLRHDPGSGQALPPRFEDVRNAPYKCPWGRRATPPRRCECGDVLSRCRCR